MSEPMDALDGARLAVTSSGLVGDRHLRCGGQLDCPCWCAGAQAEAEIRRVRVAAREITDYIRALGDSDPVMSTADMAAAVWRVYGKRP